jgi:hypothetical protein
MPGRLTGGRVPLEPPEPHAAIVIATNGNHESRARNVLRFTGRQEMSGARAIAYKLGRSDPPRRAPSSQRRQRSCAVDVQSAERSLAGLMCASEFGQAYPRSAHRSRDREQCFERRTAVLARRLSAASVVGMFPAEGVFNAWGRHDEEQSSFRVEPDPCQSQSHIVRIRRHNDGASRCEATTRCTTVESRRRLPARRGPSRYPNV